MEGRLRSVSQYKRRYSLQQRSDYLDLLPSLNQGGGRRHHISAFLVRNNKNDDESSFSLIFFPCYSSPLPLSHPVNPQEKPPVVYLSRIKQDDQRKDKHGLYRRVKKWELSELRLIDGKSADTEVGRLRFDLNSF